MTKLALACVACVLASVVCGPCDVRKTEAAQWCAKCDVLLEKTAIKDGKCRTCDEKPRKIELCVKPLFVCACGGGDCCRVEQDKPGKCRCDVALADKSDRARVIWVCEGCGAKSYFKEEVKHDAGKHEDAKLSSDVKKTCEKSGRGVHFTKH